MKFVSVAFNRRIWRLLDYTVPDSLRDRNLLGGRVLAPLVGRKTVGVVMAHGNRSEVSADKLLPIKKVFDDAPPLPKKTRALIQFCADYYHCPIGQVVAAVLPKFFRRDSVYQPPAAYRLLCRADVSVARKKARAIIKLLSDNETVAEAEIRRLINKSSAELKRLTIEKIIAKEFRLTDQQTADKDSDDAVADAKIILTAAQKQAVDSVCLDGGFLPYLLLGKTGSGKSEVYLQLIKKVIAAGRQALILAPEIHLTPQMETLFRRRFPDRRVAVLHSDMSDGTRAERWLAAGLGKADIVLGTRLAVFTPMPKLGIIIVDEEHDDSYKQEEGFIFSARNVAVWRAQNEKIPFVAGSATPALESYHNAARGRYQLLTLPRRLQKTPIKITLTGDDGDNFHGLGGDFLRALDDAMSDNGQALIFINRRGYSPMLRCESCRAVAACKNCSARMTVHKQGHLLVCHWCGATTPIAPACACGGRLLALGTGTQRVESALQKRYPSIAVARLDGDSLATRDSFSKHQQAIMGGDKKLLVGTQVIAKGHNFPKLSVIGILNADHGLLAADFRAQEKLFALLSQVIGRGTRNPDGCRVLIQTAHADHPFYEELMRDDIEHLWRRLLDERKRCRLPPFSHLALLRANGENESAVQNFLLEAAKTAKQLNSKNVTVSDPTPSIMPKIANRHRRQLLMQSAHRPSLHKLLRELLPKLPPVQTRWKVRWNVDVDPLNA